MGKNTDKLYITHSEWSGIDGSQSSASRGAVERRSDSSFKRLPFNYCALSLQPFEHPVCTPEGTVFDIMNIVPWLKKHNGTNPVNGEKLEAKELLKMTMMKNEDGEYCDPVTFKVFTNNTHLVVVKTSGNVYAWDTVERLNIKAKNWRDLMTDEEFTRKDIITIQDPQSVGNRDMSTFKYLQDGESTLTEEQEAERANPLNNINLASTGSAAKILAAKEAVAKARLAKSQNPNHNPSLALSKTSSSDPSKRTQFFVSKSQVPYNASIHTTGRAAASLTSTAISVHTTAERAILSDEDYMLKPKRVKIKGYARISTNLGNLNVELNPEFAPKAVYNFVKLSQKGYYDGTVFHRNIRNFMIQGGDPTGTGKGGTSYWGKNFDDELQGPFLHDSRGVISCANKGKNTNSSQFFICYRPSSHLDRKHTVFGKVVGGLDVLDRMEITPTDSSDRPKTDISINEVVIFVDPFEEFQKQRVEKEKEGEAEKEVMRAGGTEEDKTTWTGKRLRDGKGGGGGGAGVVGVGKYLKLSAGIGGSADGGGDVEEDEIVEEVVEEYYEPVKKKIKGGFGNFDAW